MTRTEKNSTKTVSRNGPARDWRPKAPSLEERLDAGKTLRQSVPRTSHAAWNPPAERREPVDVLEESNRDRVPELIPIRYGRCPVLSPFYAAPPG